MTSKFCPKCANLLLANSQDEPIYLCGICGYQEKLPAGVISITQHNQSTLTQRVADPNYQYDRSLPRTTKVKCPKCPPNQENPEVVIFNQDSDTFLSSYMCVKCNAVWEPSVV